MGDMISRPRRPRPSQMISTFKQWLDSKGYAYTPEDIQSWHPGKPPVRPPQPRPEDGFFPGQPPPGGFPGGQSEQTDAFLHRPPQRPHWNPDEHPGFPPPWDIPGRRRWNNEHGEGDWEHNWEGGGHDWYKEHMGDQEDDDNEDGDHRRPGGRHRRRRWRWKWLMKKQYERPLPPTDLPPGVQL